MTIKNIWNFITLYCGCHEEPVLMTANTKGNTLFYSCPKYYEENREPGEKTCVNRIKLDDYQDAVEFLCKKIIETSTNESYEDLIGFTWSKKNMEFKIIKYLENDIRLSVINKTAVK